MWVQLVHAALMGRKTPVPFIMLAGGVDVTGQLVLAYSFPFWS